MRVVIFALEAAIFITIFRPNFGDTDPQIEGNDVEDRVRRDAPDPKTGCYSWEFLCPEEKMCLQDKFVCDKIIDCQSFADEMNCNYVYKYSETKLFYGDRYHNASDLIPYDKQGPQVAAKNIDDPQIDQSAHGFSTTKPAEYRCNSTSFECPAEGNCIADSKICDKVIDCKDRADEMGCSFVYNYIETTLVNNDGYEMNASLAIPTHLQGPEKGPIVLEEPDVDESATASTVIEPVENRCNAIQFECPSDRICIDKEKVCDKILDCQGRDDEMDCSHVYNYNHTQLLYRGKYYNASHLIPSYLQGNPERTNVVEEAEIDKSATGSSIIMPANSLCKSTEFECPSEEKCIEDKKVCDKVIDCVDRADEMFCSYVYNYNETKIEHRGRLKIASHLIPEILQGANEGIQAIEEPEIDKTATGSSVIMPAESPCGLDEYHCPSDPHHECIPSYYKCDRVIDCQDFSDEMDCNHVYNYKLTKFRGSSTGRLEPAEYFIKEDLQGPYIHDTMDYWFPTKWWKMR